MASRFATVTAEELEEIIENKDAKNTKKQTETLYNVLRTYIDQKKIKIDLKTATKREIDDVLAKFYVEVWKADGKMYKMTSFRAIRGAIQRKLMNLRGDDFDIIGCNEFNHSNNAFAAQGVVLKKAGLAKATTSQLLMRMPSSCIRQGFYRRSPQLHFFTKFSLK